MAFKLCSDVRETSTTGGTGDQILAGALDGSYFPFSARYSAGDTLFYCIKQGALREVGLGTYASGNKLSRTQVYKSTNANNLVNFAAGTVDIFVTNIAPDDLDAGGRSLQLASLGLTTVGRSLATAADASAGRTVINAVGKAGDTMSGPLMLKIGDGTYAVIPLEIGWSTEAGSRWRIGLTTTHALQWGRYDSANTWISTPVEMAIDYTRFAHASAASNANVLRIGWANTSYAHWQWWLLTGGGMSLAYHSPSTGLWQVNAFDITLSSVTFNVPISKPSGTFLIDHPLEPFDKDLAHGFVESPRYDLLYRGEVKLVAGRAIVDIDAASDMTTGTFAALTTNARVMALQNQDGFARLRPGAIAGGTFEIICEDSACTDDVAWMVVAERNDPYVREIDPNCYRDGPNKGRFIVERDKPDVDDGEPA